MNIEKLYILKYKLLHSLSFFTRYFFKELTGEKFELNWHHTEIFGGLGKIKSRDKDVLIVNMPPRFSKTEIIINFVAQSLAINPKSRFLVISASDTLANDISARIRDIVLSEQYQMLFNVKLKRDTNAKGLWRTEHGGGIKSAPLNGQITGFGAGHINDKHDFYGGIIIDDADKISNMLTSKRNDSAKRFDDTIYSRADSPHTPIIIIQQRTDIKDLTGHILSGKSKLGNVISSARFMHISIPAEDKDGNPTWKKRFNITKIKQAKTNPETAYIYEAQYMQNPKNQRGVLFRESDFMYYNELPNDLERSFTAMFIDPANKGKDFFASVIFDLIIAETGYRYYIKEVIYNQLGLHDNKQLIIDRIHQQSIDYVHIETNGAGSIVDDLAANQNRASVDGTHTSENKELKIIREADAIKRLFVFPYSTTFNVDMHLAFKDMINYERGKSNQVDDFPDVLAQATTILRRRGYF